MTARSQINGRQNDTTDRLENDTSELQYPLSFPTDSVICGLFVEWSIGILHSVLSR